MPIAKYKMDHLPIRHFISKRKILIEALIKELNPVLLKKIEFQLQRVSKLIGLSWFYLKVEIQNEMIH